MKKLVHNLCKDYGYVALPSTETDSRRQRIRRKKRRYADDAGSGSEDIEVKNTPMILLLL